MIRLECGTSMCWIAILVLLFPSYSATPSIPSHGTIFKTEVAGNNISWFISEYTWVSAMAQATNSCRNISQPRITLDMVNTAGGIHQLLHCQKDLVEVKVEVKLPSKIFVTWSLSVNFNLKDAVVFTFDESSSSSEKPLLQIVMCGPNSTECFVVDVSLDYSTCSRSSVTIVVMLSERQQPLDLSSLQDLTDLPKQKCVQNLLDRLGLLKQKVVEILRSQLEYRGLLLFQLQQQLLFLCFLSICVFKSDPSDDIKNNVLLDEWWWKKWEIILLAAGDVERNPGPRRMTAEELSNVDGQVLGKDDIFDVYDAVFDCRAKWNNLCLALRISHDDLSAVEEKRHGNVVACLRDGLSLWLQGCYNKVKYGPPTWRMLVDAVANSAGGDDHSLALEIAEKHRALPNVQIAISRCDDHSSSEEMGTVSFGDKHKAHQQTHAQSVMKPVEDCSREDLRRGHQHSATFSKMYRAITRDIGRSLDVDELKQFLRFYLCPHTPSRHYVEPGIYEDAESTRDILDRLFPLYVNLGNVYLLEQIVSLSKCPQCGRLLDEYTSKYHQQNYPCNITTSTLILCLVFFTVIAIIMTFWMLNCYICITNLCGRCK